MKFALIYSVNIFFLAAFYIWALLWQCKFSSFLFYVGLFPFNCVLQSYFSVLLEFTKFMCALRFFGALTVHTSAVACRSALCGSYYKCDLYIHVTFICILLTAVYQNRFIKQIHTYSLFCQYELLPIILVVGLIYSTIIYS